MAVDRINCNNSNRNVYTSGNWWCEHISAYTRMRCSWRHYYDYHCALTWYRVVLCNSVNLVELRYKLKHVKISINLFYYIQIHLTIYNLFRMGNNIDFTSCIVYVTRIFMVISCLIEDWCYTPFSTLRNHTSCRSKLCNINMIYSVVRKFPNILYI